MKALFIQGCFLSLFFFGCTGGSVPLEKFDQSGVDLITDAEADHSVFGDIFSPYDIYIDIAKQPPAIPESCEDVVDATSTVGCLFYAVDLDGLSFYESLQYAVAVSNVSQSKVATVTVSKGNPSTNSWDVIKTVQVPAMSLYEFELPDYHQDLSGLMKKGSYKIESDIPIIAYQFSPVDGTISYSSDASMLIPVSALSQTYDIVGWKQVDMIATTGVLRTYFTVVATKDGTQVKITPSVVPEKGGPVPASTSPFTVDMDEGDVLEVTSSQTGDSFSGTHIESNNDHPIAVFTAHECAFIPANIHACDHLEEQMPGLRFWGKEFVAARMPVRSKSAKSEQVLWQIYASENDTTVTLSASSDVVGLPFTTKTFAQGEMIAFYVNGSIANPGDFFIKADKPIGVMQYMISADNPDCNTIGDPAMVYTSPVEQFLPRYVVLVPGKWENDALIVTRLAGNPVLLDGVVIDSNQFVAVANSGYEVARIPVADGVHKVESQNTKGIAVIVVGYDLYDSYAYIGGMGMGAINPIIE